MPTIWGYTFKSAKTLIREAGCTLTKTASGEYRVNFTAKSGRLLPGNPEATAYYTPDLADAVATARAMCNAAP